MTSLLEKGREFKWNSKCQDSFDQLKMRLMLPPLLVMPDLQKGFDIYWDACGQGLGCVLVGTLNQGYPLLQYEDTVPVRRSLATQ
jgi:hypothetical protein